MDLRLDVYHHFPPDDRVISRLDHILTQLARLEQGAIAMAGELDTLTTKVQETTTIEQSAIELITGLSAQIAALKNDPVQLQALADQLSAKSAELAAAVAAN